MNLDALNDRLRQKCLAYAAGYIVVGRKVSLTMRHKCGFRQENQLRRRIHYARFPMQKALEKFDLTRLEHV